MSGRPIINTRDEPHADGERFRRLHVIVGDSNMSDVATYLKVGTTALVLDMIEDGFFDQDVGSSPPSTPCTPSRGILSSRAGAAPGRSRLHGARDPARLPGEEPGPRRRVGGDADLAAVLGRWSDVLAGLAQDPTGARREVDWAIKRALIDRYMASKPARWRIRVSACWTSSTTTCTRTRSLPSACSARRGRAARPRRCCRAGPAQPAPDDAGAHAGRLHPSRQAPGTGIPGGLGFRPDVSGEDSRTVLCQDPFVAHDERVEQLVA